MNYPRIGLFVKTFKADLDWLYFGLASFKQNWNHQPTETLIVADPDCEVELTKWNLQSVRTLYTRPWPDGYCHAMAMKMCADIFMPRTDLILLVDSDMILTKPTVLADLLHCGLPTIYYDPWTSELDAPVRIASKKVWSPAVYRSTGLQLDVDWMVASVWLYWRSSFAGARQMIERHTRMPFLQAVYSAHHYDWKNFMAHPMSFCDLQTLGMYASEITPHMYNLRQRTRDTVLPIKQFWSHQPIEEVKDQLVWMT